MRGARAVGVARAHAREQCAAPRARRCGRGGGGGAQAIAALPPGRQLGLGNAGAGGGEGPAGRGPGIATNHTTPINLQTRAQVQAATKLVVPGQLGVHADMEGCDAVHRAAAAGGKRKRGGAFGQGF